MDAAHSLVVVQVLAFAPALRQHHGALLCNVYGAARILSDDFGLEEDEAFLSFLPLSHAYEHTGGQMLPIGVGAQIFYAEGLEKLAANIEEVRPTIMVVVPRLFEVLRTRIIKQIEKQGKLANYLMSRAIGIGSLKAAGKQRLRDMPAGLLIGKALRPKIQAKFGGRLKAMVSGGAPLNPEIGVFFDAQSLKDITVPLRIYEADDDRILRNAWNADHVLAGLPHPAETGVVHGGHYVFLAPCSDALRALAPAICIDAPDVDRAAEHARLNREIVEFFDRTLAPDAKHR